MQENKVVYSILSNDDIECIACEVHKTWMSNRVKDGWSYGVERDDTNLKHPCIIPYDELDEQEKDYDRATTKCVINALINNGFSIERKLDVNI